MNKFSSPPLMNKYCPHCTLHFHLKSAIPVFWEKSKHNDNVIYCLCSICGEQFIKSNRAEQKVMMNHCFKNVKETSIKSGENPPQWSLTSMLSIALNGHDLHLALENGLQIDRGLYFQMCAEQPSENLQLFHVVFIDGDSGANH